MLHDAPDGATVYTSTYVLTPGSGVSYHDVASRSVSVLNSSY